jgi:NAD(P)-dependent dehydrogenase (short-subunit alcohol dehydrogenase family)
MDLGIAGLRVLVTAGAGGIGRAIAEAFQREGAIVEVCDLDPGALEAMAASGFGTTPCDVADRASVDRLFVALERRLAGLDCLVNNAGIGGPTGRVDEIDPADWDRTLAVNITGQYNCVRRAVPLLIRSANPSVLNISSAAGRLGFGLRTPYAASKWAVIGFTRSLAVELGPSGVRVNALLPGLVAGPRQDAVLAAKAAASGITLQEMRRRAMAKASIPEMIEPDQIATHAVFLASPHARTTSGQAIGVDSDLQALS